jgi:hypothetical protein
MSEARELLDYVELQRIFLSRSATLNLTTFVARVLPKGTQWQKTA